ncbi:(deoxy)nucleoside triphosphate pyrophosphohydrolase [Desulfosporosinus youngiae]|uniref:8-oxo-dGTP diphosphatase n=1 Tax=Desulfosporosinus youngiae DSM 17734 TaxID=768710 RepID=H5XWZ9_9FIRM|nr:ADP-ribose pyrophosphatase [Desulfosporosinus youngiae DSM 17734]
MNYIKDTSYLLRKGEGKIKEVTAAVILKDNCVLIAQRSAGDKLAGKWEFPGGKTEPGETPQECLKREIKEELEVDIEVLNFFAESIYTYQSGTIKLMAFWCKWIAGDLTLKVHSKIVWVKRSELNLYDFAPADIPLAEKLRQLLSLESQSLESKILGDSAHE